MKGIEEFCAAFADALEMDIDVDLRADSRLEDIGEWDSLGKFSFLALVFSKYDVNLDPDGVNSAKTVGDLWLLIEKEISSQ
jgi:acyl carrier protein